MNVQGMKVAAVQNCRCAEELRVPVTEDGGPVDARLRCQACVPACEAVEYRSIASVEPGGGLIAEPLPAIEVHYGTQSAVLYRMEPTFTNLYLLVSLGSILGLTLGCSALSLVELAYFLARLILAVMRHRRKRSVGRFPSKRWKPGVSAGGPLILSADLLQSLHLQMAPGRGRKSMAPQPYQP
ncbi:uncharacterized protein LOC124795792 [Schistocerca piceifrons]|uniref:uncharacterized protein LOC124795792 n=1 Tax=Schistocerca piceifrons TaxID=274613 RepID=UPI001F5EE817|nr:uncharacterized protein LOC124795792 [Schistocerca piceifrons]